MAIYRLDDEGIAPITPATFAGLGISERGDLQRWLRDRIDVISPDTLVVSEEFGEWEDSRRRIDLLGIDKDANLVVIELKRTEDGGHMELQALRYAAMISTLTFHRVVEIFEAYAESRGKDIDARQAILDFLEWDEPNEESFASDVRIVLASAEFSREVTTAVLWLNERNLDIRCVRIRPYSHNEKVLIDAQQVLPLPEAQDYQVRVREKQQRRRSKAWNPKTTAQIWDEFDAKCEPLDIQVARELCEWVDPLVDEVFATTNGFAQVLKIGRTKYFYFKVGTDGTVRIWFQRFTSKPPFTDDHVRHELLSRFNQIPDFAITDDNLGGRPKLPIAALRDAESMRVFKESVEWVIQQTRNQADAGE